MDENFQADDYRAMAREFALMEMKMSEGDDCHSCYTDVGRPHCGEGNECPYRVTMLKAIKMGLLEA